MGKRYTVCTVQIRKMPIPERYMHVYWVHSIYPVAKAELWYLHELVFMEASVHVTFSLAFLAMTCLIQGM